MTAAATEEACHIERLAKVDDAAGLGLIGVIHVHFANVAFQTQQVVKKAFKVATKRALLFALVFCLCLIGHAWGQTTQTYAYQNNGFTWDTPSVNATVVVWDNTATCDRANDDTKKIIAFPGGFTFTYGGTSYNQVRILTNGILQFSAVSDGFHTDYTPQALPTPASTNGAGGSCPNLAPLNLLMPYWIDITTSPLSGISNANVRYELLGSAPNRRFVVTWDNVALFGGAATRYSFQAVLYEGASPLCTAAATTATQCANGEFEYRYTTGASSGTGATVGVQLSATDYTQYAFNQAFIDTANGTNLHWYPAPPAAQQPLAAEYRFDDTVWAGTPGEVLDTSGNGLHGVRLGAAATTSTQFKTCRAATIPNNTSNATIDAAALGNPTAATGYAPAAAGAVTFWYRPNANNADAMLFDVTAVANRPFFIMQTAAKGIRFVLSDSAGAIVAANTAAVTGANTWIHVAVSWKVAAGTNATILQVFINGTLSVVQRGTTNGLLGTLARPAFVGDNRTSGITPSGGTGNSANGFIDEVRLYNGEISVVQARSDFLSSRTNCAVLSAFDISINNVSGTSATTFSTRTCDQADISITARDSTGNPVVIAANATLSVSTAHGTWAPVSGVSNFIDTGNGGATFTFNNSATATFRFSDPTAETSNFNINSGGIVERVAADPSLVTSAVGCATGFNGCQPTTPQCTPTAPPALGYAALFTKLAGTPFNLEGVTLKSDGTQETSFSGSVTVALLANTNAGVALGANNCPTSQTATIALGDVAFSAGRATFNGISIATAYRDVRLRFTCTAAVCGSAISVCSTDNFAVRPPAFTVTANLGGAKLQAGRTFSLAADSGVGAQYSATPVLDMAKIRDHAGNLPGTLAGSFPASVIGVSTGSFIYHDVGTIALQQDAVTDANYTAVDSANGDCLAGSTANTASAGKLGCVIGSAAAGPFGRFYPDHFNFSGTLTPACAGFIYMAQPALGISFSLQARSTNESVTPRYTAGYGFLGIPGVSGDNAGAVVDLARLSPALPAATWSAGVYAYTQSTTSFTRMSSPDGPFESFALKAGVLSEPDSVAISGSDLTSLVKVRFGRLHLSNAFGGEKADLNIPVQADFWSGKSWVLNASDSCTILAANNFFLSGGIAANTSAAAVSLVGGKGNLRLAKPNPLATGSVDVALNLGASGNDQSCLSGTRGGTAGQKPWLRSRNGNCATTYDRDPSAKATFGVYSPETRRNVHVRELY